MKLQGRNLSIEMQGEDVKLLHTELRQIGYTISNEEVQKTFFGRGTRQVVLEFKKAEGLETTGIVDEKTAERLNTKVDAQNSRKYLVRGQVTQSNGTTNAAFSGTTVRAYDWDKNNRNLLSETTINERGYYEITYTDNQFRRILTMYSYRQKDSGIINR
jgi:peptidoglycan hydrolase-like protein with peptidoglycan-binding domain